MPNYQYKVIPASTKGTKAKGVKTAEGRFALSVEAELNQMGADGWEYLRAELLPSDERSGLTGSTTNWRNVLVFRRAIVDTRDDHQDNLQDNGDSPAKPEFQHTPIAAPVIQKDPPLTSGATHMLKDNGVEETSDVAGMTTSLRTRAAQQNDEPNDQDTSDSDASTAGSNTDATKD